MKYTQKVDDPAKKSKSFYIHTTDEGTEAQRGGTACP